MHRRLCSGLASLLLISGWMTGCGGKEDPPPVSNEPPALWTAPQVTADTDFQLAVTVTNSRGESSQASVTLRVHPPANHAPNLSGPPGVSSASVTDSEQVQLSLSAMDPDQDALLFSWTQEPASPAGSFSLSTASNPSWTPPEDGDALTYAWTQEPATPAGTFNNASSSNTLWNAPQVTTDTRFLLHVTVSDGKGGSVSGSVQIIVLAPVYGPTTSVTAQGCTFTVDAVPQAGKLPPYYDYVVTRQASSSCAYGAATTIVSSSYTSNVAITGNTLGIAVAYTQKNTPSGSSPVSVGIVQIAPDTLSTTPRVGLSCGPTLGSVSFSNLSIPDGTTLQVDGDKGCVIYMGGETGSGSNYHASYSDFFTTTSPPAIVAY